MKRSEMVLKIAECLIEPHHDDVMEEASYILKKLERFGMIPPMSIIELKGGYGINDCTHVIKKDNEYIGACAQYKWEPEE